MRQRCSAGQAARMRGHWSRGSVWSNRCGGAGRLSCGQVKGVDGKWQAVRIPKTVKALILLNLQSYGGGRDIWGLADTNKDTSRGWKTPIFNDGMFEVTHVLAWQKLKAVMPED